MSYLIIVNTLKPNADGLKPASNIFSLATFRTYRTFVATIAYSGVDTAV